MEYVLGLLKVSTIGVMFHALQSSSKLWSWEHYISIHRRCSVIFIFSFFGETSVTLFVLFFSFLVFPTRTIGALPYSFGFWVLQRWFSPPAAFWESDAVSFTLNMLSLLTQATYIKIAGCKQNGNFFPLFSFPPCISFYSGSCYVQSSTFTHTRKC